MLRLPFISLALLSVVGIAACAQQQQQISRQPPAADVSAERECDASGVQSYVGRNWTDALDAELRRAATSQTLRLLKPGQVMTLELNPFRLNVVTDAQGAITSLYCA